MSVLGLMESQKPYFTAALRVFKGGTTGVAEIRRVGQTGTDRDWPTFPVETLSVHWEALDAEGADALGIDLSGTIGRRYYLDGILDPPIAVGDLLIVDSVKWQVKVISQPGNNSPIDSVAAVRRDG